MNQTLIFKSVSKDFFGQEVLTDVNFSLERGNIYALIGKNGQGKSTIFNLIHKFLTRYKGEIIINQQEIRKHNAYLEKSFFLTSEGISCRTLNLLSKILDLQRNYIHSTIAESRPFFQKELKDKKEALIYTLSTGWRKFIALEKLFRMKNVDFLFLDEPFENLDIDKRILLSDTIKDLAQKGATVIISSHSFAEIQEITENVIILDKGLIKFQGKTNDIKKIWKEYVSTEN